MKLPQLPFLRQIFGALAGAFVALLVYQAYAFASPPLEAWLQYRGILSTTSSGAIAEQDRGDRLDRIAAQVRERLAEEHIQ